MFTKTTLTTLAALAALGFAASAHAAPAMSPPSGPGAISVQVSIADLNLGGGAGAKAALRRIRNAARDVCVDELNPLACMKDTIDRAVAALDNPIVTALNTGRGRPATVLAASSR
jgi:UrcA family protein